MSAVVTHVRRFTPVDRLMHLLLVVTFMTLAVTGAARAFGETDWGRQLLWLFGGHQRANTIHIIAGWVMTAGFVVHIVVVLARVDWRQPVRALFGPDSLVPTWRDLGDFARQLGWFLGLARPAPFDRWSYQEKFDYWAVFWGIPILFITGVMLADPVAASRWLPGWTLNVAVLLHRAEAVLAVVYIVVIHLLFGHFRRSTFPLNESMFSGQVALGHLEHEKPAWVERLRRDERLASLAVAAPLLWFRLIYFAFAYAVIGLGLYLVVTALPYSHLIHG